MPPRPSPPRLTHFLAIPLVTNSSRAQLQSSLNQFREDVTNERTTENPDGLPERAIRPLGTLHLTLGVMSLLTQERVDSALKLLRSLNLSDFLSDLKSPVGKEGVASGGTGGLDDNGKNAAKPLTITLKGITSMHTPSQTSILYTAPVDEDLRVQSFCLKLREAFVSEDFLVPDTRPLLLHATIFNTIYVPGVKGKGSGHGRNRGKLTIDARDLLVKYEDLEWMKDAKVEKVAIYRMGAQRKEDGGEEYVVEGEVEMP